MVLSINASLEDVGGRTALIVSLLPVSQTHIAKLVPTETSHMIAPLRLLNKHVATGTTLPILKISLEISITRSFMPHQHALLAKLSLAGLAYE